jgi:aryl-alcohol dehydrogenase-like predicted oxidoreductase
VELRALGDRTVSAIALGTVSLGADYGIRAPGASGQPARAAARAVIDHARSRGITLFDTAPAYGESEAILGEVIGGDPGMIVATKISLPRPGEDVRASIERSRQRLRRQRLDVVQIHNATEAVIADGKLAQVLAELKAAGTIGLAGASVYSEAEALAAIGSGAFDVLQVAYNLLDRKMADRVFPAAAKANVGVLVRSAYLKGALTEKVAWLPRELAPLRAAVDELLSRTGATHTELPALAVRFCLAAPAVGSVLIGARTSQELDVAIDAAAMSPLGEDVVAAIESLQVDDERLLNPSTWPVP